MANPKLNPSITSSIGSISLNSIFDVAFNISCISSEVMTSKLTLENFYSVVEEIQNKEMSDKLCVVSSWTWWDVVLLSEPDAKPSWSYLTSNFVIKDFLRDVTFADCIKSSPIIRCDNEFTVETAERTFILVGNGWKKSILGNPL